MEWGKVGSISTENLHIEPVAGRRFLVLRTSQKCLSALMKPLFRIMLLQDSIAAFASIQEEVSVVIDSEALPELQKAASTLAIREDSDSPLFQVGSDEWSALQVHSGCVDISGGISLLSTALAAHDISLLNFSTFTSDLLFVRRRDLISSLDIIRKSLVCSPSESISSYQDIVTSKLATLVKKTSLKSLLSSEVRISCLTKPIMIAAIRRDALSKVGLLVTELMFYNLWSEDEISVFMDEDAFKHFESSSIVCENQLWCCLRLHVPQGFGFDECGIVSAMCVPLSESRKQFLNVSTYSTNYTLVLKEDVLDCLRILSET